MKHRTLMIAALITFCTNAEAAETTLWGHGQWRESERQLWDYTRAGYRLVQVDQLRSRTSYVLQSAKGDIATCYEEPSPDQNRPELDAIYCVDLVEPYPLPATR